MVRREPQQQQCPQGQRQPLQHRHQATLSLTGNDLSINFGANGITSLLTETGVSGTGSPTSSFGDGWYALGIDPTGNPSNGQVFWVTFFRLLGDTNGDGVVTGPYTTAGTDAYTVYHAEGQSGPLLDADVNGDGVVNTKDLSETAAANGHSVGATPRRESFPQFQLFAGATAVPGNAVPVTQTQVQALLPEAIAAWQAAGLDAADVRQLESVPVQVGNLGTSILGLEAAGAITINQTAAGNNWYWARTGVRPAAGRRTSRARQPGGGEVDLLTVLEHELGHVIGLSDNTEAGDLMDITLGLGVRRSPTARIWRRSPGHRAPRFRPRRPPSFRNPALLNGSVSGSTVDAALASIWSTSLGKGDDPEPTGETATPAVSAGPVLVPGVPSRKKIPNGRIMLLTFIKSPARYRV